MSKYPHLDELAREVPEVTQFGSLHNRIADGAFRLGKSLGIDDGTPEMADFIRGQLAEGIKREVIDKPPTRINGQVIPDTLSEAEREAARISNISPEEYLAQKKLAIESGQYGLFSRGY
jgi:hypothetical protein